MTRHSETTRPDHGPGHGPVRGPGRGIPAWPTIGVGGAGTSVPSRCEECRENLGPPNPRGRRRRFCDARCRSAARRQRIARQHEAGLVGDPAVRPFPAAVKAAIDTSDRTLRQLAAELGDAGYALSPSTLSQWSRGTVLPRFTDDLRDRLFMLERLSWAPTGSLVRALLDTAGHDPVRRARPVPRQATRPAAAGPPGQDTVAEASRMLLHRIGSLFGPTGDALTVLAYAERHIFDHRRLAARTEITATVAAVTGTADRYWYVDTAHHGGEAHRADRAHGIAACTVVTGDGCVRGAVLADLPPVRVTGRVSHQLAATELKFGRRLAAGAEHTFSFTVHHGHADPATGSGPDTGPVRHVGPGPDAGSNPTPVSAAPAECWTRVPTPAVRDLRFSVAFDPAERPTWARRVHWPARPNSGGPQVVTTAVQADGSMEGIFVALPAPGWYGYQWD